MKLNVFPVQFYRQHRHWQTLLILPLAFLAMATRAIVSADYTVYTVPGTTLELTLAGDAKFNSGGTVTHHHPRGTLYFNIRDIRVIKNPTPETVFLRRSRVVIASKKVDEIIDLAKWAVRNGMIDQCKTLLSAAWKIDPENAKLKKLAGLIFQINKVVEPSESAERHLREFVNGPDMTISRSKHFVLIHNGDRYIDPVSGKTRADMRLGLMEKVYEAYFLSFAFNGLFLRPPKEPMEVVLFAKQADFLHFAKMKMGRSIQQLAGFYLPPDNVAIFFDNGTSAQFQKLNQLVSDLKVAKEEAKRSRVPGAGEIIRFFNTLELLVDITRESEDVATVSHEAIHQLNANTGIFPDEKNYVRWVDEGLASYFQSSKNAIWTGVGVVDSERIDYYRLLEGDPVRGSLEFIVSDIGFLFEERLGNQLPAYGQAWALTHFLFNTRFDDLMKFYKASHEVKSTFTPKERGELLLKSFKDIFGDPAGLELEWRRYMRSLKTDMELLDEDGKR